MVLIKAKTTQKILTVTNFSSHTTHGYEYLSYGFHISYEKAWWPYLNSVVQTNGVTRSKLVPRLMAKRWIF